MTEVKYEFAVRMTCQGCADAVTNVLSGVDGINKVSIDLGVERVVVETTLPSLKILELIESTGKMAVLQGMGSSQTLKHKGAGVAQVSGNGSMGVIRFLQADDNICIIEGTIDGLNSATHKLFIHEEGNLSSGCDSCGDIFKGNFTTSLGSKYYGDLGSVDVNSNGRAVFNIVSPIVKVPDVIGRSLVIHDSSNSERVSCGIIARSAGLFENEKRICLCDGTTLWDEKNNRTKNVNLNAQL